jgi:hypothetical protein
LFSDILVPARLARRARAAVPDRRGTAAIEFGIVMAAIMVIILGTYDIGNYVLQEMKLADAAHVVGQYAISYPDDTTGMTNAMDAALPPAWIGSVELNPDPPVMTCTCGTSGPGDAGTCSAGCGPGQIPERFVKITLTLNYTTLNYTPLNYTPLLLSKILTSPSASYVARVQ